MKKLGKMPLSLAEVLLVLGFISAMYGLHRVYPPSPYIVGGGLLMVGALNGLRKNGPTE